MSSNKSEENQDQQQEIQQEKVNHVDEQDIQQPLEGFSQQQNENIQNQSNLNEANFQVEERKEDFIQNSMTGSRTEPQQDNENDQQIEKHQIHRTTITIEDQELQDLSQMEQSQASVNNISENYIQDQSQQQNNNQQQQQPQQIEEDEQNNNAPLNPTEIFARMIGSMNNEPFLNEETLVGIYQMLHLDSQQMFDEIDRSQPNWKEQVENILKKRLEIYNKKVELISNIYQSKIPNNSMHNIEKIMSIIKSKEKEIYIQKLDKRAQHFCKHHQQRNEEDEDNSNQQNQEQNDIDTDKKQDNINIQGQKNEKDTSVQDKVGQDKQCEDFNHNHIKGQNENEDEGQEEQTKQVNEDQNNQKDIENDSTENLQEILKKEEGENEEEQDLDSGEIEDDISEENLEKLKKKLQRNEEIRRKQEEQKKLLIEENQRLKREYEEMIEKDQKLRRDYQSQMQIENYLLQKEAALQAQQQQLQEVLIKNISDTEFNQSSNTKDNEQLDQNNLVQKQEDQETQITQETLIESTDQSENQINQQNIQTQTENIQDDHDNHHQHQHHHHHHHQNDDIEQNQRQENNNINEDDEQQQNQNSQERNSEEFNKNILPFKILGESLSINNIHSIMSLQFVDLHRLKSLNPIENSITFEMNDNYLIKIKGCEQIKYDKTSLCSKIPHFIFKEHIFPFLSSIELFRVRSVSPEWRELVREVWHKTFKRDMQEQLLATDLCKEIEAQFQLMHIRNPFFQKLNILIRAMIDIISWEDFEKKCLENRLNTVEKKIIVSLLRIIGYNILDYENINQFDEQEFDRHQVDIALHLKDFLTNSLDNNGTSSQELKNIYENFLVQADISISTIRNDQDKNFVVFILISKQYFVYSLLRNYINSSVVYMQYAKNKLDALSKDWLSSKGFLEGAYRILLLRNVSIKNGKIVNNDSEDGEETKLIKRHKKAKKLLNKQENEQINLNREHEEELNQNQQQQNEVNENQENQKQQISEENEINLVNAEIKQQEENHIEQAESQEIKKDEQQIIENQNEKEGDDEEEEEDEEEKEQSQAELAQLMNSIFNLSQKENQEPDIVIKRKTGVMKIFLDQGTKLDIILNTVITFGMQTANNSVTQEACNIVQSSKVTLERLEQKFNENQQQIDEMKIKSQQLEQSLLEKQAELEKVQIQNQQLQQEFQRDSQEILQLQNTVQVQEEQVESYENFQNIQAKDEEQENIQNKNNQDIQEN